ncbi:MAG: Mu transposase C-terminal domain-containing protein [Candidatus Thiodiazotropha endolucinida]
MRLKVKKGEYLVTAGLHFVANRRLPDGRIQFEALDTGEIVSYTDLAIAELVAKGDAIYKRKEGVLDAERPIQHQDPDFDDLPAIVQEEARRRYFYVTKVAEYAGLGLSKRAITRKLVALAEERGDAKPPSIESYYRWKKIAGTPPRLTNLVERKQAKGNRKRRVSSKVQQIIDDKIAELVMRPEPEPISEVWSAIRDEIERYNEIRAPQDRLKKPGKTTVYRAYNAMNRHDVLVAQKGQAFADRHYRAIGKGPETSAPLEVVEIDHTRADLFVLHDETKMPLGRPWVTALVDRYSKMVVGFYLGFVPPSYHSVAQALKNAILPKSYVKELYPEIENDWPCFGLPFEVVTDRGMEFIGHDLADTCGQLGIHLGHSPTKMPWYKGAVERFFGTLNSRLLHSQKGTTFSDIFERDDYDPEKNAVITYSQLMKLFHMWLIDDYSQSLHQGLEDIPAWKWKEGCNKNSINFIEDVTSLRSLIGRVEYRKLKTSGIDLAKLRYCNPEIVSWLSEGDFQSYTEAGKVRVKYDPADLGRVWVQHPRTLQYAEVLEKDFEYSNGLSEWQHKVIRNLAVSTANGKVDLVALDRAKERLRQEVRAILEGRRKPGRIARDRAARAAGVGQTMPSGDEGSVAIGELGLQQEVIDSPVASLPSAAPDKNRMIREQNETVIASQSLPSDDDDIYAELEDEDDY